MDENARTWIEFFDGRLEKVEQIMYGLPPLRVPGILERIENAERRARRAVWILALCTSIIWLLTALTLIGFIISAGQGA